MGKIAFVFSGQGAQKAGMGKEFYEQVPKAKALLDQAEQMRKGTLEQMFGGSAEELKQTENTQPCLYLTDLAAAIALQEAGIQAEGVAGFSLGEIPALAFAGAYSMTDGFLIAQARGNAMGRAAKEFPSAMAAVLKLSAKEVEQVCAGFTQAYPVNYNCEGQTVVSVANEEMDALKEAIRAAGGRAMPIATGGGFHSPFMHEAAAEFGAFLQDISVQYPTLPVYANATAKLYPQEVKEMMAHQIDHPLLWQASIEQMAADGYDTFIEAGIGNTLEKLIGKILPDAKVFACSTMADVDKIRKELGIC